MPEDRFVFESVLRQPYLWERIMTEAKSGDRVKVHYTGTLGDGRQFDSSRSREPLEFVIGEGSLIPGFEQAVVGMDPGENRVVNIPATEAYGQPQAELVRSIPRNDIPDHIELSQGLVRMQRDPTEPVTAEVAMELAQREGVKAVVAGEVLPLGPGAVVSTRLVAAGSGETLVALRETARTVDAVPDAVDRLSAQMRERIGESLRSIQGLSLIHISEPTRLC